VYQNFPIRGPPKFTQTGIFGLKINHLATLMRSRGSSSCSPLNHLIKSRSGRKKNQENFFRPKTGKKFGASVKFVTLQAVTFAAKNAKEEES
jgi:hypothetical protein